MRRLHYQVMLDEDLIQAVEICLEKRRKKYGLRHPKATKAAAVSDALRQVIMSWTHTKDGEPSVYLVPVDPDATVRADIQRAAAFGVRQREDRR